LLPGFSGEDPIWITVGLLKDESSCRVHVSTSGMG
jgi:hypothetical protein